MRNRGLQMRWLMAILPLLACGCSDPFDPAAYWPLFDGYNWQYSRLPAGIAIEQDRTGTESGFFALYSDSTGCVSWREHYISRDRNLYWDFLTPSTPVLPIIRFEPAIPILPFSDQVGDQKQIESVEKVDGRPERPLMVRCKIEEVSTATVPSGTFDNVIRMSMQFRYLGQDAGLMAREHDVWFAKGVGPVRIKWGNTVSELQSAALGSWQIR